MKCVIGEEGESRVCEIKSCCLKGRIEKATVHLPSEHDSLNILVLSLHELKGQSCKVDDKRVYFLPVIKCHDMRIVFRKACVQEISLDLIEVASAAIVSSLLWIRIRWFKLAVRSSKLIKCSYPCQKQLS